MDDHNRLQRDVVRFLSDHQTHHGVGSVEVISTHISEIFLVGDLAFKMKRAVRFLYLDFSTLALRHQACEAELRKNYRTAPDIYLDIVSVTRDLSGELSLDGDGDVVEWLVKMHRFADDALLNLQISAGSMRRYAFIDLADHIVGPRHDLVGGRQQVGDVRRIGFQMGDALLLDGLTNDVGPARRSALQLDIGRTGQTLNFESRLRIRENRRIRAHFGIRDHEFRILAVNRESTHRAHGNTVEPHGGSNGEPVGRTRNTHDQTAGLTPAADLRHPVDEAEGRQDNEYREESDDGVICPRFHLTELTSLPVRCDILPHLILKHPDNR